MAEFLINYGSVIFAGISTAFTLATFCVALRALHIWKKQKRYEHSTKIYDLTANIHSIIIGHSIVIGDSIVMGYTISDRDALFAKTVSLEEYVVGHQLLYPDLPSKVLKIKTLVATLIEYYRALYHLQGSVLQEDLDAEIQKPLYGQSDAVKTSKNKEAYEDKKKKCDTAYDTVVKLCVEIMNQIKSDIEVIK